MDNHLCSFLANVEAPYPVEHSAAFAPQIADIQR
jgi:hypothetical protein